MTIQKLVQDDQVSQLAGCKRTHRSTFLVQDPLLPRFPNSAQLMILMHCLLCAVIPVNTSPGRDGTSAQQHACH